jgi:uncharacterized protein DUF1573
MSFASFELFAIFYPEIKEYMHNLTRNVFLAFLMAVTSTTVLGVENPPAPPAPAAPPVPAASATNSLPNTSGPKIEFATPVYDFGRVRSGDLVKYGFAFTNGGDEMLQVTGVQPSCGCTTAGDWSRNVKPGETGKVPIQFNSANFNGPVFKTISVTSNDKQKPVVVLQLKGTIWKPIELVPPYTIVNVPPDASSASASIRIINNTEDVLTLSDPESSNKSFNPTVTTTKPGKEFQLTIASGESVNTGNLQGKISFKTSWTNIPTLEVPFWVNVQPPLMVIPPHVMLPHAPLVGKSPTTVTIQNNSTNALTLSEAAVNVPGVDVEIKEIQPGRVYHALLTFPEGFEIPAGKQVTLTMKSSNPRMPEIRVPVSQAPRPIVSPTALPQPQQPATSAAVTPAARAQATH